MRGRRGREEEDKRNIEEIARKEIEGKEIEKKEIKKQTEMKRTVKDSMLNADKANVSRAKMPIADTETDRMRLRRTEWQAPWNVA